MIVTVEKDVVPFQLRGAVDHVDAMKSTKELKLYHSFDLLQLLRFCRQERRSTYDLMKTLSRVKGLNKEYAEGFQDAFNQYDYWTKKTRVIESLVRERIGSVPKAITNDLLEVFFTSFQEAATQQVKFA